MPLQFIGEDLPARHTTRESRMTEELSGILNELRTAPSKWAQIDQDQKDPERMHRKRYRFHQIMSKDRIEGYEFTVRNGVLYGRKK